VELLEKYAWYVKNSQARAWPVGSKKPNDLGFFDMHGNVWNRCQDRMKGYPVEQREQPEEDKDDELTINSEHSRVSRGGSFKNHASNVRAADRTGSVPTERSSVFGFRVARTMAP
jgi:formylglycine-generating enzyme required for sulfatase activity